MSEHGVEGAGVPARERAAAAMRRLGHAMVGHQVDADLLERIAHLAAATAATVESCPPDARPAEGMRRQIWLDPPPDGQPMTHFPHCMVSGPANPMGVAMQVRREGARAVADLTFGAAFEGAPRRAHGGAVAAVLDDIMGYVLALERTPAYTGHLGVSYRAATPVGQPLRAEAWLDRREGRKLFINATLSDAAGMLVVEAEGLFITIVADPEPVVARDGADQ